MCNVYCVFVSIHISSSSYSSYWRHIAYPLNSEFPQWRLLNSVSIVSWSFRMTNGTAGLFRGYSSKSWLVYQQPGARYCKRRRRLCCTQTPKNSEDLLSVICASKVWSIHQTWQNKCKKTAKNSMYYESGCTQVINYVTKLLAREKQLRQE